MSSSNFIGNEKKVKIGLYYLSSLLKLPQADAFIKSAGKQKAKILSDNLVRLADGMMPYRVITKRLPSGTTIAQALIIALKHSKK